MDCPKCKSKMIEGFLTKTGWKEGRLMAHGGKTLTILGGEYIVAYRCGNCGFVELYVQPSGWKL